MLCTLRFRDLICSSRGTNPLTTGVHGPRHTVTGRLRRAGRPVRYHSCAPTCPQPILESGAIATRGAVSSAASKIDTAAHSSAVRRQGDDNTINHLLVSKFLHSRASQDTDTRNRIDGGKRVNHTHTHIQSECLCRNDHQHKNRGAFVPHPQIYASSRASSSNCQSYSVRHVHTNTHQTTVRIQHKRTSSFIPEQTNIYKRYTTQLVNALHHKGVRYKSPSSMLHYHTCGNPTNASIAAATARQNILHRNNTHAYTTHSHRSGSDDTGRSVLETLVHDTEGKHTLADQVFRSDLASDRVIPDASSGQSHETTVLQISETNRERTHPSQPDTTNSFEQSSTQNASTLDTLSCQLDTGTLSPEQYNDAMYIFKRNGKSDLMLKLVEAMIAKPPEIWQRHSHFHVPMHEMNSAGCYDGVLRLYEIMQRVHNVNGDTPSVSEGTRGTEPTLETNNYVLAALGQLRRPEDAMSLFRHMTKQQKALRPNNESYGAVMEACDTSHNDILHGVSDETSAGEVGKCPDSRIDSKNSIRSSPYRNLHLTSHSRIRGYLSEILDSALARRHTLMGRTSTIPGTSGNVGAVGWLSKGLEISNRIGVFDISLRYLGVLEKYYPERVSAPIYIGVASTCVDAGQWKLAERVFGKVACVTMTTESENRSTGKEERDSRSKIEILLASMQPKSKEISPSITSSIHPKIPEKSHKSPDFNTGYLSYTTLDRAYAEMTIESSVLNKVWREYERFGILNLRGHSPRLVEVAVRNLFQRTLERVHTFAEVYAHHTNKYKRAALLYDTLQREANDRTGVRLWFPGEQRRMDKLGKRSDTHAAVLDRAHWHTSTVGGSNDRADKQQQVTDDHTLPRDTAMNVLDNILGESGIIERWVESPREKRKHRSVQNGSSPAASATRVDKVGSEIQPSKARSPLLQCDLRGWTTRHLLNETARLCIGQWKGERLGDIRTDGYIKAENMLRAYEVCGLIPVVKAMLHRKMHITSRDVLTAGMAIKLQQKDWRAVVRLYTTSNGDSSNIAHEGYRLQPSSCMGGMIRSNPLADDEAYNTLLQALLYGRQWHEAVNLVKIMRGHGCMLRRDSLLEDGIYRRDTRAFSMVVTGLCKLGSWKTMGEVLSEMRKCGVKWDTRTFNCAILRESRVGDKGGSGMELFEDLQSSRNVYADYGTMVAVLDVLSEGGGEKEAEVDAMYNDMCGSEFLSESWVQYESTGKVDVSTHSASMVHAAVRRALRLRYNRLYEQVNERLVAREQARRRGDEVGNGDTNALVHSLIYKDVQLHRPIVLELARDNDTILKPHTGMPGSRIHHSHLTTKNMTGKLALDTKDHAKPKTGALNNHTTYRKSEWGYTEQGRVWTVGEEIGRGVHGVTIPDEVMTRLANGMNPPVRCSESKQPDGARALVIEHRDVKNWLMVNMMKVLMKLRERSPLPANTDNPQ